MLKVLYYRKHSSLQGIFQDDWFKTLNDKETKATKNIVTMKSSKLLSRLKP